MGPESLGVSMPAGQPRPTVSGPPSHLLAAQELGPARPPLLASHPTEHWRVPAWRPHGRRDPEQEGARGLVESRQRRGAAASGTRLRGGGPLRDTKLLSRFEGGWGSARRLRGDAPAHILTRTRPRADGHPSRPQLCFQQVQKCAGEPAPLLSLRRPGLRHRSGHLPPAPNHPGSANANPLLQGDQAGQCPQPLPRRCLRILSNTPWV